ncbi:MAG: hypothetical protein UMU76_03280 [Prosthecochloris sp.]|nr:hypothetical protein [Prosthecochloris sp.]
MTSDQKIRDDVLWLQVQGMLVGWRSSARASAARPYAIHHSPFTIHETHKKSGQLELPAL